MSKGRLLPLLGTVAIAALLAGCGGSSGSDSSASVTVKTSSLSQAQFVKRANALCLKRVRTVGKAVDNALKNESNVRPAEVAVLPVAETIVRELQQLGAPSGEEQRVETFLAAMQGDIEGAKERPSASMTEFAEHFKRSGDLARGLKLESCALG